MIKASVIICTHNPRQDYLGRVLAALKEQTLPKDQWELLLMDNASREPLMPKWDLSWHPHSRHLREEKVGKTNALLLAIAEFKGELFVIVDDDNVLRRDYLETALKISQDYPWLGAWSGTYVAEYETEPPAELRPWLASVLVVDTVRETLWAKLPRYNEASPVGAGMVVRRPVAQHYREQVLRDPLRQALGRSGTGLGGGEDGDMGLCTFGLGYGTGRFPDLELRHLIGSRRLTLDYFTGVHQGFGYAEEVLNLIHGNPEHRPKKKHASRVRLLLLRLFLLITRKSPVERRLRLAREKGRICAIRDLKRLGYLKF